MTSEPNEAQLRILQALGDVALAGGEGLSDEKLAEQLDMAVEEVRRDVQVLIDCGFVASRWEQK